jgi:hypothetical protein
MWDSFISVQVFEERVAEHEGDRTRCKPRQGEIHDHVGGVRLPVVHIQETREPVVTASEMQSQRSIVLQGSNAASIPQCKRTSNKVLGDLPNRLHQDEEHILLSWVASIRVYICTIRDASTSINVKRSATLTAVDCARNVSEEATKNCGAFATDYASDAVTLPTSGVVCFAAGHQTLPEGSSRLRLRR